MDWQLFTWIHSLAGKFLVLDEVMKGLSSYTIYVLIGILILLACFSKSRNMAFVGIGGIIVGMGINYVITLIYSRPRPFVSHDVVLLIDKAPSASFPSDTVVIAFATAFSIWLISRSAGWMLLGIAVLVGISRVYVGHHYPTDVLAGSIVGIVSTYLCLVIYNKIMHRNHQRHHKYECYVKSR